MPNSNLPNHSIRVYNTDSEELEVLDDSSDELAEFDEDEEALEWFQALEDTVMADADARVEKRKELIKSGETFQTVEHDVENVLSTFWDFLTR